MTVVTVMVLGSGGDGSDGSGDSGGDGDGSDGGDGDGSDVDNKWW